MRIHPCIKLYIVYRLSSHVVFYQLGAKIGLGSRDIRMQIMQATVAGAQTALAGNFLAGLHSLFIGQNCRFEQRFTRAYKTVGTSCILLQY